MTPKPGKYFNANLKGYSGPKGNSPTNKGIAKEVGASKMQGAFKKSFKNPQFLPGEAADSVA